MKQLRSAALIILVLSLGVGSSLLPRYVLDDLLYRATLHRFLLFVAAPLTAVLLVFGRVRRGQPNAGFDRIAFRIAWAVMLIGILVGTCGALAIGTAMTLGAGVRQMVGFAGFSGVCAAIVVGQKLLRDSLERR
jgi:hypothetical protein